MTSSKENKGSKVKTEWTVCPECNEKFLETSEEGTFCWNIGCNYCTGDARFWITEKQLDDLQKMIQLPALPSTLLDKIRSEQKL